jgi:hypothetical protein
MTSTARQTASHVDLIEWAAQKSLTRNEPLSQWPAIMSAAQYPAESDSPTAACEIGVPFYRSTVSHQNGDT